ncbi:MAG: hypothetical protein JRN52_06725 [Nitrososphaerota archaeon]|nr:hypothetical protein [Nitrososphaerota archaeon]
MSVKKLIFSAAASLLFLWFVVPLLGMDTAVSMIGTATVLVVAVFSVSAAGLIAEGCTSLMNNGKLPLLKSSMKQGQPAQELADPDVASVLGDLGKRVKTLEEIFATFPKEETSAPSALQQSASQKQNNNSRKNRVDVLLGAKEVTV